MLKPRGGKELTYRCMAEDVLEPFHELRNIGKRSICELVSTFNGPKHRSPSTGTLLKRAPEVR